MLGSSGVGKSSLINGFFDENKIKVGEIGLHSGRGKYITTTREMYFIESGGIIIDNPGMREVEITDIKAGLEESFDEIMDLAKNCKFADCTHVHKSGCAILKSLESGILDKKIFKLH